MTRALSLPILAALLFAALPFASFADDKKREDPKTLAQKLLDEGAKEFNRKDARVMARFYTEDAEARLISKENDASGFKTETYRGRAEIEEMYGKVFKGDEKADARNTVEYARYLGDGLILITGLFEPQITGKIKLEFVQIRQKDGDQWQIRDMQVFLKSTDE
jgi:hypothetical protein